MFVYSIRSYLWAFKQVLILVLLFNYSLLFCIQIFHFIFLCYLTNFLLYALFLTHLHPGTLKPALFLIISFPLSVSLCFLTYCLPCISVQSYVIFRPSLFPTFCPFLLALYIPVSFSSCSFLPRFFYSPFPFMSFLLRLSIVSYSLFYLTNWH